MANKSKYTLQEVTSPQLAREFLNLPKRIYKGNRNWVCPLDEDIEKVFDPARNPLFGDGEAIRWLVRNRKNEVVGRIAAFYNREQAAIEEQPTGGCGFFEAINDQEVADLLFDAARMWLASRGMEAMDGPINFGPRDTWWGLLVEGYEFQPLYANPYNPPYYKELFRTLRVPQLLQPEHLHLARERFGSQPSDLRPHRTAHGHAGLPLRKHRHAQSGRGGRKLPHHLQQGVGALFGRQADGQGAGAATHAVDEIDHRSRHHHLRLLQRRTDRIFSSPCPTSTA